MTRKNNKKIIALLCILFQFVSMIFIPSAKVEASGNIVNKSSASNSIFKNVVFGNGIFLVTEANGNISKSTNGINWSIASNSTPIFSKIVFGGNGTFAAIDGSTAKVYTSTDGITWTSNNISIIPQGIKEVNGKFFVWRSDYIDGSNPQAYNAKLLFSEDGVIWNDTHISSTDSAFGMQQIGDITFGSGKYVVSASSSAATFYTSADLSNWTTVRLTDIVCNYYYCMWPWIYNVTFLNGRFFSYCSGGSNENYGAGTPINKVLTSTDGSNWIVDSSWDNHRFTGGVSLNSTNILFGENGMVYHSSNAPLNFSGWTTSSIKTTDMSFSSIAYGNGKYVACGDSGILTSSDFINWYNLSIGEFDKNTEKQADIYTTMTLSGNTLTSIKNGTTTLVNGTDYIISGDTVTIKSSYLANQVVGTTTLIFNFSNGDSQTLDITVSDTTPPVDATFTADVTGATNGSVKVTINYPADAAVKKYSLDGITYNDYTGEVTFNGNGTVYAKSQDVAGNWSAVSNYAVTNIDKTAPVLTPGAANITSDVSGTVKFTSTEAGKYYYQIVNHGATAPSIDTSGAGTACNAGETTISLAGLTVGEKDIYIIVKDNAGNISSAIKISIVVYEIPYFPPEPPEPTEQTRVVPVVVENSDSTSSVQVPIVRKIDENGLKTDTVSLDNSKTQEVITNAVKLKSDLATIVVTDIPNDNAQKVVINVPKTSIN